MFQDSVFVISKMTFEFCITGNSVPFGIYISVWALDLSYVNLNSSISSSSYRTYSFGDKRGLSFISIYFDSFTL